MLGYTFTRKTITKRTGSGAKEFCYLLDQKRETMTTLEKGRKSVVWTARTNDLAKILLKKKKTNNRIDRVEGGTSGSAFTLSVFKQNFCCVC